MQDRPLITVIVPVYNIMKYLPRCVESIQKQTYSNLEILLVDDGSGDGTGALCDQLALSDDRIRVFHKENGGSSSARNYGLDRAKGEYIGFVDSDDYISPDMYEKLLNGILKEKVLIAQVGRDEIGEDGSKMADLCSPLSESQVFLKEEIFKELLMHRGDCSFCTKLVHRSLFDTHHHRFPIGVLNEDFHLLMEILPDVDKLLITPGQDYHVFYRMGSNSRKKSKNEFSRVYGDNVDNADFAMQKTDLYANPDFFKKIAFRFGVFQRLDYLLHIPISMMEKPDADAPEEMHRIYAQYRSIVRYMRRNYLKAMTNAYLTKKNKIYHTLFIISPKSLRKLHFFLRLKGK